MVVVAWLGLALRYLCCCCCEEKGDPLAAALHWNAHDDDDDDWLTNLPGRTGLDLSVLLWFTRCGAVNTEQVQHESMRKLCVVIRYYYSLQTPDTLWPICCCWHANWFLTQPLSWSGWVEVHAGWLALVGAGWLVQSSGVVKVSFCVSCTEAMIFQFKRIS